MYGGEGPAPPTFIGFGNLLGGSNSSSGNSNSLGSGFINTGLGFANSITKTIQGLGDVLAQNPPSNPLSSYNLDAGGYYGYEGSSYNVNPNSSGEFPNYSAIARIITGNNQEPDRYVRLYLNPPNDSTLLSIGWVPL